MRSKARLYHSTNGGRELDAHVHQIVFTKDVVWMPEGQHIQAYCKGEHDYGFGVAVPYYATEIKDAWKIIEIMKTRGGPESETWKGFVDELVRASELPEDAVRLSGQPEVAPTFEQIFWNLRPITICRAALEMMQRDSKNS